MIDDKTVRTLAEFIGETLAIADQQLSGRALMARADQIFDKRPDGTLVYRSHAKRAPLPDKLEDLGK